MFEAPKPRWIFPARPFWRRGLCGLLAVFGAMGASLALAAAPDPREALKDEVQEAKAREIFQEVRCVVCQNESIDDSDAEIAGDLRKIIRDQVAKGRSRDEVLGFLTNRYGEFILLRPRVSLQNALLWGAPILVILCGFGFLYFRTRRGKQELEQEVILPLTEEEDQRLKAILAQAEPAKTTTSSSSAPK